MSVKQRVITVLGCCMIVSFLLTSLGLAKKTTLSYGMWGQEQLEGVKEQVKVFEQKHPNIHVKVNLTTQYWVKLQTSVAGGTAWDVFWMNAGSVGSYAQMGVLADLTPLIERDKVDLNDFSSVSAEMGRYKGKQYYIPRDFDTIALSYNKNIFDQAGEEYPNEEWTWSDLLLVGEKLTKIDAAGITEIYGFTSQGGDLRSTFVFLHPFAVAAGQDKIYDEDEHKVFIDTFPMRFVARFGRDLTRLGISPKFGEIQNAFMAEKCAMDSQGSWMLGYYCKNIENFEWGVTLLPKYLKHGTMTNSLGNVIYSETENREEAWEFVKWLAGAEAEKILGRTGSVLPAHKEAISTWVNFFPEEFRDTAQVYIDSLKYAHPLACIPGYSRFDRRLRDYWLTEIYAGNLPVVEGLREAQKEVDQIIEEAMEVWK